MKFAKVLLAVFFSLYILLGVIPRAMSRTEVPGQTSGTSEDASVKPASRDKAQGMMILYGTQDDAGTSIPPPPVWKHAQSGNYLQMKPSQFVVTYTGFTDEAKAALEYAVDIWDSLIRSPVPIKIDAIFTDFGGYDESTIILGGAYPAGSKSLRALNLRFVDALADNRAGRDLDVGEPDIITKFNSHEDANWYFGTDGNTPSGQMDFVSTVLHEIAHGLGFFSAAWRENTSVSSSSLSADRGELRAGTPELPHIYDFLVVNGSGTAITSFPDPSTALLAQFTSNNLFWKGEKGTEANGGIHPQLYAPSAWSQGSSYTHLDETTFPAGDINALMTAYLNRQEAAHHPGPIALGMLEDMGWKINRAPMFTDGIMTTRTVAENTGRGIAIGSPVAATDADNDALTYQLSGNPDAAAFDMDSTSGQLKTKAALDHETKAAYTVTITVSDGNLAAEITVVIIVANIVVEVPTNSAPSFTEDRHTTRTVAENTARGVHIGDPIAATDTDNDTLTYTLSGLDAAAFDMDSTTGQLKTRAALDYETKRVYTVTVTVSDGSRTDTITVTINITDVDDQESPTITLTSRSPLTEATLNGSVVTLKLRNRTYENWLSDPVTVSGIDGVTIRPANVARVSGTALAITLTFDGTDFDTDATLTFTVKADAIANYTGPALTRTINVTASTESVIAASAAPLTEATLNGSVVTLTLSSGTYESRYTVGNNLTVSGIIGVSTHRFNVERLNGTQVNVELIFDGTDFDTDATLTFTVGAGAIAGYNGSELTAQLPVVAVVEENPTITAYTPQSLTEATLNESVVTLTLSTGVYTQSSADIRRAVTVSGIDGVTFQDSDVVRLSGTQVTIKLTFGDTDFDTDATLTFTVAADAIVDYNGPALIVEIRVTAVVEEHPIITVSTPQPLTEATLDESVLLLTLHNGTYVRSHAALTSAVTVSGIRGVTIERFGVVRVSDRKIMIALAFNGNFGTNATLTITIAADAIAEYDGPARSVHIFVNGGQESVVASTAAPLTEATLNGSVVTLTLNGAAYERSIFNIREAMTISGIDGVTIHWFDLERISDTTLTAELTFNGNLDADATLTITVGADAIAGYTGSALIAHLSVTGSKESVVASTAAPLTEATLDGSVVTLTLSGRTYERSISDIRAAVSVSGIAGVTIHRQQARRKSDTHITMQLNFEGNINTNSTLTFTLGAGAIAEYNGTSLTTQIPVIAVTESVVAVAAPPLTEATLDDSVVTLTLSGRKFAHAILDLRAAVSVSGIEGVSIHSQQTRRKSDTHITIQLNFDGNINTDSTLTFTVGAGAIANYKGPALTAQIAVTANRENVLLANFPNPFNPETWIPYQLAKPTEVIITIYAVNGNVVRTLALGHQPAGMYQSRSRAAYWDGRNALGEPVASGVYFYTLTVGDFTATRKMLIRK